MDWQSLLAGAAIVFQAAVSGAYVGSIRRLERKFDRQAEKEDACREDFNRRMIRMVERLSRLEGASEIGQG